MGRGNTRTQPRSEEGNGGENAERGGEGEGINKTVFISPFNGECSLSFVFVLLWFSMCTVHGFNIAYLWMEKGRLWYETK
jgi:hypothetical protein